MAEKSTLSIGYYVYVEGENGKPKELPVLVIKRGTDLFELMVPKWSNRPVNFYNRNKSSTITIYIDDEQQDKKGRIEIPLDKTVEDILPNVIDNRNYFIGFSLDEKQIPTLHIKDDGGTTKPTYLKDIWEKIVISGHTKGM